MELFGGTSDTMKFIIVFLLLLLSLIPLLWWRKFNIPLGSAGLRGRQQRLAVVDTAAVDVRRRLILVKRDNVEHLLMIGGPTDIVVESNIARAGTVAREPRPIPDVMRPAEVARAPAAAAETPDWSLPLEPMGRPVRTVDLDAALLPEPPARTAREAMVDSMRAVRSGAAARRGPDLDAPPEEIDAPDLTPAPAEVNHRPVPIPEPRRAPPPPEPQRPQPAQEPAAPSNEVPESKRGAQPPAPPRPVPLLQPAPAAAQQGGSPAHPSPRQVQPAAANGAAPPQQRPVQPVPAAANGSTAPAAPRPAQPAPATAAAARPTQADENSLAEMAQRLEAALRRPTKPADAAPARTQGRPEPAGRKHDAGPAKSGAKPADSPSPTLDLKVMQGKGNIEPALESLEDEMAKMLGRPGKS